MPFNYLGFNASERATVNEAMENLIKDSDVAITNLEVSQATSLELNDRKIVEANIDSGILKVMSKPGNEGTNSCTFLLLDIVNRLTKNKSEDYKSLAESAIINFQRSLTYTEIKNMLTDVYEAHNILSKNGLHDLSLTFFEI